MAKQQMHDEPEKYDMVAEDRSGVAMGKAASERGFELEPIEQGLYEDETAVRGQGLVLEAKLWEGVEPSASFCSTVLHGTRFSSRRALVCVVTPRLVESSGAVPFHFAPSDAHMRRTLNFTYREFQPSLLKRRIPAAFPIPSAKSAFMYATTGVT
jgi:hypothetical protein